MKRERALGSSEDEDREDAEIYDDDGLSIRRRNSARHHSKEDEDDRGTASDGEDERRSASSHRRSSSDPVNLSLVKSHGEDSDDGNIDVETIGNAPPKVSW